MLPGRHDRWQRDPRAGVLVIVAGAGLLGFAALAAAIILAPAFVRFDMTVSEAIRAVELPGLEGFARFATRVGDFWPMAALTAITAAFLYVRGRHTSAITLAVTVLGGSALGALLKMLFMRVRPALEVARIPLPETYSFPSGHALSSFLYFGSLAFLLLLHEKRLRRAVAAALVCFVVSLSIALSRVYLGVHYLGDVIGAWLLGAGWLALAMMVAARWSAGGLPDEPRAPGAA